MAIIVTGAGLVGCHTAQRLLDRGAQPVLYDLAPNRPYVEAVVDLARVPSCVGTCATCRIWCRSCGSIKPTSSSTPRG